MWGSYMFENAAISLPKTENTLKHTFCFIMHKHEEPNQVFGTRSHIQVQKVVACCLRCGTKS